MLTIPCPSSFTNQNNLLAISIAASVSREGKRGCFWVDLIAGMSQPKGGGGPGGHGRSVNPLQTRGEGADFSPRS